MIRSFLTSVARLAKGRKLADDFSLKSSEQCVFCGRLMHAPKRHRELQALDYLHCRKCNALFSDAPMPDYGEEILYAPSPAFLDENIAHYRRFFAERPALLEALGKLSAEVVIDLAGGTGIFPRMISNAIPKLQEIRIVEVGAYASDSTLHANLDERLETQVPVSFVQQDVFSFLHDEKNICPNRLVVSFVHFIDHLRQPDEFLAALKQFARGREVYILIYCHSLDSYKGRDWFVINTRTKGEHQIIYSHRALKNLIKRYGQILQGDIYSDDQYLLAKLNTYSPVANIGDRRRPEK